VTLLAEHRAEVIKKLNAKFAKPMVEVEEG
jgi:hypothetical protein